MALTGILSAVVDWLRAGYPNGIQRRDYIPLLAILTRRLSNDEVRQVTDQLVAEGTRPADKIDVAVQIAKLTDELPRQEDVQRVRDSLLRAGWQATDDL